MAVAALVVAVITFLLAFFIHSETRETLGRINAITDTLPGAHDVKRVIKDIENTKQLRAKVVCDSPKNTHVAFSLPAPDLPLARRIKNRFWRLIHKVASYWSGDIYESIVAEKPKMGKWEFTCVNIYGSDIENKLAQGWEPFSVTDNNILWLRKYSHQNS